MSNVPQGASTHEWVKDYYGKLLASSDDLQTNACCAAGAPAGWIASRLQHVHPEVSERFYGCGFPIPQAVEGATVLDLGCGTGRDAFVIAQLVGEQGRVIGLDMTEEQLATAKKTEDWHAERFGYAQPNTSFVQGYIEDLKGADIEDGSVDVIVSNCVVNLSPRKDLVLTEAYRALKPGGELYFSDVFVDRRLPEAIANDPLLHAECLGGALYQFDFETLAKTTGFSDPRVVSTSPITINNPEIIAKVGLASFVSVTYRLFKLDGLDAQCEDYGQSATYLGGVEGAERLFWLDDHHAFEAGRPERVCGNTAAMLASTRFADFFEVRGCRQTHYGAFACGPTMAAAQYAGREIKSPAAAATINAPKTSCC
ncbi:methyltransferase domain-containing protein [Lujinxingia vulgaris]|uniref:Arsenite methyltransferase n=1 Tax=Lujinxingia vulgaris TaxID=2600176 RepID=A0A5C6XQP4_9DELT|nr:methyltransferase domain-containing protein [Lujinxingia vulgaris]TXD39805.1 methyltransferase domain-containing protein [Lujinxingia vulgaris]